MLEINSASQKFLLTDKNNATTFSCVKCPILSLARLNKRSQIFAFHLSCRQNYLILSMWNELFPQSVPEKKKVVFL